MLQVLLDRRGADRPAVALFVSSPRVNWCEAGLAPAGNRPRRSWPGNANIGLQGCLPVRQHWFWVFLGVATSAPVRARRGAERRLMRPPSPVGLALPRRLASAAMRSTAADGCGT